MQKKIRYFGLFSVLMIIVYIILIINPKSLFAYSYEYKNFSVFSDRIISANIENVLEDVRNRLEHSELYTNGNQFKIFLCNDNWRFKFFSRNGNAGGIVNFVISPNIFIRQNNIDSNTISPPKSWIHSTEDRPLSYFIAHEGVHSLQRNISSLLVIKSKSYILEGYADYIAKSSDFDMREYVDLYKKKNIIMDPNKGLYAKYHLYIAFLIEYKGFTFYQILSEEPDIEDVLKEVATMY